MLKLMKTKYAFLAPIFLTLTMGLNSCGEKEVTIPNTLIHRFEHKVPESVIKSPDFSSDEYKPFMDGDMFFLGTAIRKTIDSSAKEHEFEIGVQFMTEIEGQKIFVEKMVLDTPDLQIERVVNEFVNINLFDEETKISYKRFSPFEKISGDSIPLTAEFFMLTIDYRLDDKPTKQMSIRFDNASFWTPIL